MLQLCRAQCCMWVFMRRHRFVPARALMFYLLTLLWKTWLRTAPRSLCHGVIYETLYLPAPNVTRYVGECLSRRLRLIWDFILLPRCIADGSVSRLCWGKSTESSAFASGIHQPLCWVVGYGGGCFETKQQAGFYAWLLSSGALR